MADTAVLKVTQAVTQLRVTQNTATVLKVGVQGPSGAPGKDGAGSNASQNLIITAALETSFTLANTPNAGSLRLYQNGLRERNSNFSVTGSTVSFAALDLGAGDTITFDYSFGI